MYRGNCNFKYILTFCVLFPFVYLTLLHAVGQKAVLYAIDHTAKTSNTTTLVSAYFPLTASKHSSTEYINWLSNFFSNVNTPMVIYTTPQFAPTIQELRGDFPTIIRTQYESPFNITPLQGLEEIYHGKQHDLDREKAIHNGNLYAIWNSKPFLVAETAKENPFNSEFFFWVDSGSFRDGSHIFRNWPDPDRVREVFAEGKAQTGMDSLLLGVVYPPEEKLKSWRYNDGPIDADIIEGGIFGGRKELVVWWSDTYYNTHDYYLSQGYFVGKEQPVMNSLAIRESSKIIIVYLDSGSCGDRWFYFQPWLASVKERGSYDDCNITPVRSMKKWWNGFFPEMEYLDSIQLSVTDTLLIF